MFDRFSNNNKQENSYIFSYNIGLDIQIHFITNAIFEERSQCKVIITYVHCSGKNFWIFLETRS